MNITEHTDRADLEAIVLENGIIAGHAAVQSMSDRELYDAILEWVEAGDECHGSCY